MPLSSPEQRFHLALWRWSSKNFCEQRSEVHFSTTSSWPHFVSRERQKGPRIQNTLETTFHPVTPTHREFFLKYLSSREKVNRVEKFPAATKTLPVPKRDSPVSFTFHDSSSRLGPSLILSKSKESRLLQGSRFFILVAHTHLVSAMGDCFHWVLVCLLAFPSD